MSDEKALTELVEEAVEKGATTVEEIHRSIADLPLTVLERLGLSEEATSEVRKVQETSIGAIYDLIRDINHKVGKLSTELLEQRKGSRESRE
jgi:methyl-accepting chemotaxis protein